MCSRTSTTASLSILAMFQRLSRFKWRSGSTKHQNKCLMSDWIDLIRVKSCQNYVISTSPVWLNTSTHSPIRFWDRIALHNFLLLHKGWRKKSSIPAKLHIAEAKHKIPKVLISNVWVNAFQLLGFNNLNHTSAPIIFFFFYDFCNFFFDQYSFFLGYRLMYQIIVEIIN